MAYPCANITKKIHSASAPCHKIYCGAYNNRLTQPFSPFGPLCAAVWRKGHGACHCVGADLPDGVGEPAFAPDGAEALPDYGVAAAVHADRIRHCYQLGHIVDQTDSVAGNTLHRHIYTARASACAQDAGCHYGRQPFHIHEYSFRALNEGQALGARSRWPIISASGNRRRRLRRSVISDCRWAAVRVSIGGREGRDVSTPPM